jgi:hypothetical protein
MYGGGSVSQKLGDFLIDNDITLRSVYGGSEVGGPAHSSLREDDEKEWEYVEFSENCDVRWIPQGDGIYECHLYVRLPPFSVQSLKVQRILTCHTIDAPQDTATYHLSVQNLPNAGYATSDLFKRHPTKDYLWKLYGYSLHFYLSWPK